MYKMHVYIFVTALVLSFKRSCNLLVFIDIKCRYLMMRTCRPTVKLNIYQKTDKYTRSFIFNCISVEKNLQSEICTNSL